MNIRTPKPTQAARVIKDFFNQQGFAVTHAQALEAVAKLHGYTNWQAMSADKRFDPDGGLALKALSDNEFALHNKATAAWIQAGAAKVSVTQTGEGVIVDLFKAGQEDTPLAGATLSFDEIAEGDTESGDEEAHADWARASQLKLRFKQDALEEAGFEFIAVPESMVDPGHFIWRAPTLEGEGPFETLNEAIGDAWQQAVRDVLSATGMAQREWDILPWRKQLEFVEGLNAG